MAAGNKRQGLVDQTWRTIDRPAARLGLSTEKHPPQSNHKQSFLLLRTTGHHAQEVGPAICRPAAHPPHQWRIGKHAITQQRVGRPGRWEHTRRESKVACRWWRAQPNKKHIDARHLCTGFVVVKQDDGREATMHPDVPGVHQTRDVGRVSWGWAGHGCAYVCGIIVNSAALLTRWDDGVAKTDPESRLPGSWRTQNARVGLQPR